MVKQIWKILTAILLAFTMMTVVGHADETSDLEFSGDAKDFIFLTGEDLLSNMKQMMPGETRTQSIRLENSDDQNLQFYLKTNVLRPLDEGTNNLAVYTITLTNNGEVIYKGNINGMNEMVSQGMKDNEILLADLKTKESTFIELSMYLDGDSMDNTYQDKEGSLQFIFSVEHKDPTPQEVITKIVNKIVPGVNTGEALWLTGFTALFFGSGIIIVLLVMKKKRGERHEHH